MSVAAVFALTLLSLIGLGYMAWSDPKRRRTFKQTKLEHRPLLWPARAALFGPGVLLFAIDHWSGFTIWAGTVTVLGWIMAAISPGTYARLSRQLRGASVNATYHFRSRLTKASAALSSTVPWHQLPNFSANWTKALKSTAKNTSSEEVTELKARITALEARLHRLENEPALQNSDTPDLSEDTVTKCAPEPKRQIS